MTTHDQVEMKATAVEALRDADNAARSYSVIGVDEGQFYPGARKASHDGYMRMLIWAVVNIKLVTAWMSCRRGGVCGALGK